MKTYGFVSYWYNKQGEQCYDDRDNVQAENLEDAKRLIEAELLAGYERESKPYDVHYDIDEPDFDGYIRSEDAGGSVTIPSAH